MKNAMNDKNRSTVGQVVHLKMVSPAGFELNPPSLCVGTCNLILIGQVLSELTIMRAGCYRLSLVSMSIVSIVSTFGGEKCLLCLYCL